MNIKSLATATLTAIVLSSTAHASITVFTDRAAWEAAVSGSFSEETFSTPTPTGFTIEEVGSGHSTTSFTSGIYSGVFNDRTVLDSSYTNYRFTSLINAFGANWDLSPQGPGQGLQLFEDGTAIPVPIDRNYSGGFFGFVSTTAFNVVSVHSSLGSGVAETHSVDNVVFSSAVPEPESFALMLAGLGLVGTMVRRRKSKQA